VKSAVVVGGGMSSQWSVDKALQHRTLRQLQHVLRTYKRLVNVQHCQHRQTQLLHA